MCFVRRAKTAGKVEIPATTKKEVELTFLHKIVNNMENFQIPSSLLLNLDQTNSKYLSMDQAIMAEKGSNQKKYRHNFCRKFKWKISPDATDIWREKNQSLPKSKFPVSFSLSTNPKH